ncbi:MAG TPA: hypothetical protein VEB18_02525 [Candidatus Paceibacterota bacterium]|nr:hypothetical protein [Candidatus Paceibacterota bacterium]
MAELILIGVLGFVGGLSFFAMVEAMDDISFAKGILLAALMLCAVGAAASLTTLHIVNGGAVHTFLLPILTMIAGFILNATVFTNIAFWLKHRAPWARY